MYVAIRSKSDNFLALEAARQLLIELGPQAALAALFESGKARLTKGTPEDFKTFFGYFEPASNEPIALTVR